MVSYVVCEISHFIILSCSSTMAMGDNTMEFFNLDPNDLTVLTWSHATNSKALLKNATEDTINMIEADVTLGIIIGSLTLIPIMAHPPAIISDLSLEALLVTIIDHNNLEANANNKKGLKLDFKSIEAFNRSIEILEKYRDQLTCPLWINADILPGPTIDDHTGSPVNPDMFLTSAQNITDTVLSIGWTTNMKKENVVPYNETHITAMKNLLNKYNITDNVTFPVRAAGAALSIEEMVDLIKSFPKTTLTLWSPADDAVNVTLLNQLVKSDVGKSKCYTDLPEPWIN